MNMETVKVNAFEPAGLEVTFKEFGDYAELHHADEKDWPDRREPKLWMYDRRETGNVVHFIRPKITTHNAATVIGDLTSPEADALLTNTAIFGLTDRAPRVSGDKWGRVAGTYADMVNALSHHPERADKGGDAIFFAESPLTGKRNANGVVQTYKLKKKIQRVFALAIDVDGGTTVEAVITRLRAAGFFAVIYTTHSHTSKGKPGSDRFRVILPLSEPFELGDRDTDPAAWEACYADWLGRYFAVCEVFAGDGDFDASASLPSQLMYAPARPKGAEYKHYILAGLGLDLSAITPVDYRKYRKAGPSGVAGDGEPHDGAPAILSDGFDLMAWHGDHGENFLLSDFLEMIGWDVGGSAGAGFDMLCPNSVNHTSGGNTAWGIDGTEADNGATIYCHHGHCKGLASWNFLRLIESQCELPAGYDHLSQVLCDPMFYGEVLDGEAVNRADYIEEVITIEWLKTPMAVKKAFGALSDRSSEDAFAAIYAGVAKSGNRRPAVEELAACMKALSRFKPNDLKRLEARGRAMLKLEEAADAAQYKAERHSRREAALVRDDLANPSMDPAEPLGDDLQASLATLGKRYAVVDLEGRFRVVRTPDLDAFKSETDSTIVVYRKDDFLDLHLDRQVMEGDRLINPAKEFLETAKRKSGLVFAPPPVVAGPNDFNMYQGRKLKSDVAEWPTLKDFIFRIVCGGDVAKFDWLILWMAHMVQFPGEKPGTAVICRGEDGTGKGTFGRILAKLVAPHVKTLEKEAHVIGQFAGEHLSKCILAIVTEAVFGANPKVSSELKALVDSFTMQVEAKGMNVLTVLSYIRLYIDSNDSLPILIEGNGSERRYFVMEISTAEKQNLEYFANVVAAMDGKEMAGLLHFLEQYDPASAGLTWDAVRTAPETAERKLMGWHSMRPPARKLLEVLLEGKVMLTVAGELEEFTANADGLKVPRATFRDHIAAFGDKRRADDSDVVGMFERLFPGVALLEGQGRVGTATDTRWMLFPSEVLGDAGAVLQGTA